MVYLDKKSEIPLYEQLYEKLKDEIVGGELEKNSLLRSVRVLSKELQISKNTVDRAYQQLLSEGYIRSVPGSGYYVENVENEYFEEKKTSLPKEFHESVDKNYKNKPLKYDFFYSSVDSESFPWSKWKKYVLNAVVDESYISKISYENNKGNLDLRKSLCKLLNRHRGVVCEPEQIIICPGTQYAIEMLTNILTNSEYRLAYEEPGYDAIRNIFLQKKYKISLLPVKKDGIDTDILNALNCNLLYLTPSHQFPTGVVTTLEKRKKILKWAQDTDAYIIENDYDSEFRYGDVPIPALQSLDTEGKVIYLGTLSKILLPSIRCAYIVLPKTLLPAYEEKYKYYNSSLPSYHQRALFHFIDDGNMDKHIRRISYSNECKYNMLTEAMHTYIGNKIEIFQQPSGAHTLVSIPGCIDQEDLIDNMRQCSIGIYGTKQYYYNKKNAREDQFLIGFYAMSEEEIWRGCKNFAKALQVYFR